MVGAQGPAGIAVTEADGRLGAVEAFRAAGHGAGGGGGGALGAPHLLVAGAPGGARGAPESLLLPPGVRRRRARAGAGGGGPAGQHPGLGGRRSVSGGHVCAPQPLPAPRPPGELLGALRAPGGGDVPGADRQLDHLERAGHHPQRPQRGLLPLGGVAGGLLPAAQGGHPQRQGGQPGGQDPLRGRDLLDGHLLAAGAVVQPLPGRGGRRPHGGAQRAVLRRLRPEPLHQPPEPVHRAQPLPPADAGAGLR